MRPPPGYYVKRNGVRLSGSGGDSGLEEDFGYTGAVANNDDIPAALQAVKGGTDLAHPH
jgi:hypothetical protein